MAERLVIMDTPFDGVIRLSLNRPERRNALTVELLDQLLECIATAEAMQDARMLVLTGLGQSFCAGMDLIDTTGIEPAIATGRRVRDVMLALCNSPLPSIAVVRGPAVAGGAGLVIACDFALATEDATFGFPEVRRGIVPAMAGTLASLRLGDRVARELLLAGVVISAERARECGAFSEVVRSEEMDASLAALAGRIRAAAPHAVSVTRSWLFRLNAASLEELLDEALGVFTASMNTGEAAEGLAAFREKREPAWRDAASREEARGLS